MDCFVVMNESERVNERTSERMNETLQFSQQHLFICHHLTLTTLLRSSFNHLHNYWTANNH
jgi:hypothetical protein